MANAIEYKVLSNFELYIPCVTLRVEVYTVLDHENIVYR